MDVSSDKAFLTSYFTMLNKCFEDNSDTYLIQFTKLEFEIDTIPTIQDIPRFIADPQVIKVFNTNENTIRMYYKFIKQKYDKIMLKNVILKPSAFYIPIKTFIFGSVRQQNAFNQHFNKNSSSSMLLNVDLHGGFISKTPKVMSGIKLNKYNNAAPGQCTGASRPQRKYIVYALSDAVLSGSIIDIPTIIREGNAHATNKLYEDTPTNKDIMFNLEITKRNDTTTAQHSGKVGEEITYGNSFFEKSYELDKDEPYGVFLCKDWYEIGGNILDNLLANPFFIHFMNEKYDKAHLWGSSRNVGPIEEEYFGPYLQLCTPIGRTAPEMVDCIKKFVSSDLFEFCEEHGRPEISLLDSSCSVFTKQLILDESSRESESWSGSDLTDESPNIQKRSIRLYDEFTHPKNASVAKGTRKSKKGKLRVVKNGRKGKGSRKVKRIKMQGK
jgi:hypothetical protein